VPLINCPECQNKVSNKASDCPYCGYPLSETDMQEKYKDGQPNPNESELKRCNSVTLFQSEDFR